MTYEYPSSVRTHFLGAPEADRCLWALGVAPSALPPPGSLWHLWTSSLSFATLLFPSTEPCLLPSNNALPRRIITSHAISNTVKTFTRHLNSLTVPLIKSLDSTTWQPICKWLMRRKRYVYCFNTVLICCRRLVNIYPRMTFSLPDCVKTINQILLLY